jgi:hypothetical protein
VDQISSLAIEISDLRALAGRRPRLAWQELIRRCDPATPGKHPATGNSGIDLHVFHYGRRLNMKKLSFAAAVASAWAAVAIGLAGPALADAGSRSNVPPPGVPVLVYPQMPTAGANPYTPIGVDPYVPYGVWAQH